MTLDRRTFLTGTGVGALTVLTSGAFARLADARGLLLERTLDEVVERALQAARKGRAQYADIRIHRRRYESIDTREDHITDASASDSYGFGIRVLVNGAWGFAASSVVSAAEAERVAALAADMARANASLLRRPIQLAPVPPHVDVWQTPLTRDPFRISPADKAELLLAINAEALKVKGVAFCSSFYLGASEWKLFASTDGARLEQNITRVSPGYTVTAVDKASGEFVERDHPIQPMQAGWEYVERSTMLADARRMGEDAVEKLRAPSVEPGKKDLVLSPENLFLTIHESVGHPTELDRVVGYEANLAGTSFATLNKLNKLRYGAPIVSLYGDKTTPGGLATCGYDDDGVKCQRFDIVKDGVLVGYQTSRDQAHWIGEKESRGTCYAQDYRSFPFQRMPNVSLEPGKLDPLRLKDIIAATEDGIYVDGHGSWSIDHQRYNFQFGGQMFYEIKKGRMTRALKDVAYQSNSIEFWNNCDMIAGPSEWKLCGAMNDGKGEPTQSQAVSHGCSPARFRNINILNTNARGA
jgi:TldD protein